MPRELITKSDLIDMIRLYQEICEFYKNHGNKLIVRIPLPRLTPVISESLTYHLIRDLRILRDRNITEIRFSSTGGDLEILEDGIVKKVEVKSTAQKAFQYFSAKDLQADYLIWMHFGNVLTDHDAKTITIVVVNQDLLIAHSGELPSSGKITLKKFRNIFQNPIENLEIYYDQI